jgi:hypothetical protein
LHKAIMMRRNERTALPVLAAILSMLVFAGCAGAGSTAMARQAGTQCPAGFTVTCEVRTTGRIHHGSFGKNYDSCACVSNDRHAQTTPVIPRP